MLNIKLLKYFKFVAPQVRSVNGFLYTDLFGRFQIWKQVDSTLRDFVSITQTAFPWSFWRGIQISIQVNMAGMGLFIFPALWAMACDVGTASQYLSTLFDKQISKTFGYVLQCHKVDEIVKEWEIKTKSSFTPWMAEKKTLGTLVCFTYLFLGHFIAI